jgi:GT2 family glycosyltransferase
MLLKIPMANLSMKSQKSSQCPWLRDPLIIVPFWRNEYLVHYLVKGLIDDEESLKSSNAQILLICDSPEDANLQSSLKQSVFTLAQFGLRAELIINDDNEGFVRSANKGLKKALSYKMDAFLLNSDAILTSGVLSELREACAIDPMIGFVSPRSNNASICTIASEWQKNCSLAEGKQIHERISKHLPRFRYVLTAVGFCLYIRYPMLVEFGLLNEIYQFGYHEENDLIMCANRAGYRAVLANHAYVHHFGSASFGNTMKSRVEENEKIINHKFPEFPELVNKYFKSPEFSEENIRSRCITSNASISLLFDLSNVQMYHNGTYQHAVSIIRALPGILNATPAFKNVDIYVSIDEKSAIFHGMDRLKNIRIVPVHTLFTFDAVVRIGQPWHMNDLIRLANLAPVNVIFMEDPIAWDCGNLRGSFLDSLWKIALKTSNGILYSSEFTRNQFLQRFGVDGLPNLLSTDPVEYTAIFEEPNEKHLLIVGNHFMHKAIPETVKILAESFPNRKIIILGAGTFKWDNVQVISSGLQSEDTVHHLYKDATEVVFPSHYEGFGFPVIQALAYRKKVFARNTPLLMEIAKHSPRPDLIIPFDVLTELPHLITSPKPLIVEPGIPRTWADHASDILHYTLKRCDDPKVDICFRERLDFLHSIHLYQEQQQKEQQQKDQLRCQELEAELQRIYQSKSWKVATQLRKMKQLIRSGLKTPSKFFTDH